MRLLTALLLCLLTLPAMASPPELPPALQAWRGWALDRQEFRDCPLDYGSAGLAQNDFVCLWPGVLDLRADATGARFSIEWRLHAASWVTLPGDREHWPQAVQLDGQAVPVMARGGSPQVRLSPGRHVVSGRLAWARRPQSLPVPAGIGIVRLQVDGQSIVPVRHEHGQLILGRTASEAPEADALALRVFRRLHDGAPIALETVIELVVAGQAREALIGPVLPAGFVPTALSVDAGWPARLEADGRLRVQLQPDVAQIRIQARAVADASEFNMPASAAPWPEQEIWSYQPRPSQRISTASGPPQVDPAQAGVPEEWRQLPAFALVKAQALRTEIRSRGLGDDAHNRLQLQRQAWLDHSGAGWTFHDQIHGQMRQDWRLDMQAPYRLEHANDRNEGAPLLVTRGAAGSTGVEWRTANVALAAGVRGEPASWRLPVHGWRQTFDAVVVDLHLPYGYRLIAAPGADNAEGSWVSRWSLLDLFLAALIGLLAWRSLGMAGLVVAAVYIGLGYHEGGAPLFTVVAVLGLLLLARALPAGRLATVVKRGQWGAWLLLVMLSLPFVAGQIRLALYPQLEGLQAGAVGQGWQVGGNQYALPAGIQPQEEVAMADAAAVEQMAPPPAPAPEAPKAMQKILESSSLERKSVALDAISVTGSRLNRAKLERYTQNTIVQAGRGVPAWRGSTSHRLSWSGPVTAEQSVRLWVSPPWLTRSLRVLTVLALVWLLARLAGWRGSLPLPTRMGATAMVLMVAGSAFIPATALAASLPDNGLRKELSRRLTRPPECAPDCVSIASSEVAAHAAELDVSLEVHVGHRSAVPIPASAESLSLQSVRIDGVEVALVAAADDGLRLPVERGVHRIDLRFAIIGERVDLDFPLAPQRIETRSQDWQFSGISEGRLLTDTLVLTRRQRESGAIATVAQEFPPYVRVRRTLNLGLEWTIDTQVERIAPATGGFSVKLPLLAGEKVVTAGLKVREGGIELPIPDGVNRVGWQSNLDKGEQLHLLAAALSDHAEDWQVLVSPLWRADFSGVPESVPEGDADNGWHVFSFQPLPGESLKIAVSRPEAAEGGSQAIENVQLESSIGQRANDHSLRFVLRASQGGERLIGLPEGAELLAIERDGETLSLRLESGRLSLPVHPGTQTFSVRFREGDGVRMRNVTPLVQLGLPAANISLAQTLPDDRWVLRTHGPATGPAVLYWGELIVVLVVAWALSRQRWTPLRLRDWLLLGVGFSTFSWWALLAVVAWLFALAWRQRYGADLPGKYRFDAMQLGLVGLSVIAALALITAIPYGLLGRPDMHIVNPLDSYQPLRWFADQSGEVLPTAGSLSVPMWSYRVLMLLWALWLANAVIGWLRWAVGAWTAGGYWRRLRREPAIAPTTAEDATVAEPPKD